MPQKPSSKNQLLIALSILLSSGIILALIYGLEWSVFLEQFARVQMAYLPLIVFLLLLSMVFRAIRWKYLLAERNSLSTRELFDASMIGFLATMLLPLRAGEFVRPFALHKISGVSFSAGFASIVIERVFDVLVLLFLLGLCLQHIESVPEVLLLGAQALAALAGLILVVMILAYLRGEFVKKKLTWLFSLFFNKWPSLLEKFSSTAEEFIDGLKSIRGISDLFFVFFYSLCVWGSVIGMYQAGFWAFGEFPDYWAGVTLSVAIALAVAAPSAPGFIGTFQAGCVLALSGIYAYSQEFAIAYSVLAHGIQFLVIIAVGSLALSLRGLGLSELRGRTS